MCVAKAIPATENNAKRADKQWGQLPPLRHITLQDQDCLSRRSVLPPLGVSTPTSETPIATSLPLSVNVRRVSDWSFSADVFIVHPCREKRTKKRTLCRQRALHGERIQIALVFRVRCGQGCGGLNRSRRW